jgi:hypothetical protein
VLVSLDSISKLDEETRDKQLAQYEADRRLATLRAEQLALDPAYQQRHYRALLRRYQMQLLGQDAQDAQVARPDDGDDVDDVDEELKDADAESERAVKFAADSDGAVRPSGSSGSLALSALSPPRSRSASSAFSASASSVSTASSGSVPRHEQLHAVEQRRRATREQQKREWDWQRLQAEGCTFAPHIGASKHMAKSGTAVPES